MEKLEINKEFWKDKRILVTGHTGFKGSWLILWLQKLESVITGFSKDIPTTPSLFELSEIKNEIDSISGDIRNFDDIKKVIHEKKPEIIIHLAAQSLVPTSYENPRETYETNVMGTINLLESVRSEKNKCIILNVTSDKCYENKELSRGYTEEDRIGGYDPYSSSKGCSELITTAYQKSFFNSSNNNNIVTLASARSGNVIGGGDWAKERLIPDLIKSITNETSVLIRNPNGIRPWQHVLEPLSGYLKLIEKMEFNTDRFSEGWNFGPNKENKTVSWIIDKISELYGIKCNTYVNNEEKIHETQSLNLDCTKAKNELGWEPKINLEQGLQLTVDWYKHYENNNDMRKITEKQIDNFNFF
jgi:CDP-glucose 4,6-dehydratase